MHPKADDGAIGIAETLLAVTLNASSCVSYGDWETASQLLRRRDQLLELLARCDDLSSIQRVLPQIRSAEAKLASEMDAATMRAMEEISRIRRFRNNRQNWVEHKEVGAPATGHK